MAFYGIATIAAISIMTRGDGGRASGLLGGATFLVVEPSHMRRTS